MAKKSTVTKKTAASSKGASGTNTVSGLQMSAARWKAYDAAYNATSASAWKAYTASQALAHRNAAINAAALSLRRGRLSAAYRIQKKAAAAHTAARTAAIAAFAVKMSYRQSRLSHQSAALQSRVFADYERHIRLAGRLQFAYKGERAYAHQAVMSTLTAKAALNIEQARFAAAAKTAKKASSSVVSKTKVASPASKAESALIKQTAQAAGIAAARSVPLPPKTAKKKAPRTAPAPFWRPRPQVRHWFGNPQGLDCVAAAVANHMLAVTGCQLLLPQYQRLVEGLGAAPDLEQALTWVMANQFWVNRGFPMLIGFGQATTSDLPAVIGFDTPEGGHAAVVLGGHLATWGELVPIDEMVPPGQLVVDVEEAWDLRWIMVRVLA